MIKNFDSFDDYILMESIGSQSVRRANPSFANRKVIKFSDDPKDSVTPDEIIDIVERAIDGIHNRYPKLFKYAQKLNVILLPKSEKIETMAVDGGLNLYISASFVFHTLRMDVHLVSAIILHEIFHVFYDHITRGKEWLRKHQKSYGDKVAWTDTNLAADVEVNRTLTAIRAISRDALVNVIHGIYLDSYSGNIVPMEDILDDEKLMEKLRLMANNFPHTSQEMQKIKTTDAWDTGYKECFNKLADFVNRYGAEHVLHKLEETGLINALGEIDTQFDIDDFKNFKMEFLYIHNYDDYVNGSLTESLKQKVEDMGQTYDNGYMTAFNDVVSNIYNILNNEGESGDDSGENNESPYQSNIKDEDLKDINVRGKKQKQKQSQKGSQSSGKIKIHNTADMDGSNDEKSDGKQNGENQSDGQQSQGRSNDNRETQSGDGDLNDFLDRIKKSFTNREDKDRQVRESGDQTEKGSSIGNFGEKIDADDVLKDAGYTDDEINQIKDNLQKELTDAERTNLSKEFKNDIKNDDRYYAVSKTFDAIEVSSKDFMKIWENVMSRFLAKRSRNVGNDIDDDQIVYTRKAGIVYGIPLPTLRRLEDDPQDINVLVDVSGSIDDELVGIVMKSLVVFKKRFEYSGLNICPWSDSAGVPYCIGDNLNGVKLEKAIAEALNQKGVMGGGTYSSALIESMMKCMEDKRKTSKDDVNVVITDGWFDYDDVESKMKQVAGSVLKSTYARKNICRNTVWMLYDKPDRFDKSIVEGEVIYIDRNEIIRSYNKNHK